MSLIQLVSQRIQELKEENRDMEEEPDFRVNPRLRSQYRKNQETIHENVLLMQELVHGETVH